jgi:tetratricopeptide (TPR) repeat protein
MRAILFLFLTALGAPSVRAADTDPAVPLDAALAGAETALRAGERAIAESRHRGALLEAWLLRGSLDAAAGRWPAAREAYMKAASVAVESRRAYESLALVHLQMGETTEAVALLSRLAGSHPKDVALRRLLAQALVAQGKPEQAVQELEEVRSAAPDDLELVFALATGNLRLGRIERADRLFDEIAKARPIPQTHVLIGRMYREYRQYAKARASLRKALALDPKVRRAHFYLGTVAAMAEEAAGLEEALAEFRLEHAMAPDDPLVNQHLGIGLVEGRRYDEALPVLQRAAAADWVSADTWHYLGRALLALERPAEALDAFRRAESELQKQAAARPDAPRLRSLHYQLGLTLRALGRHEEAAAHFEETKRHSAERAEGDRERLARYLSDAPPDDVNRTPDVTALVEGSPLRALPASEQSRLHEHATAALVRAYTNLGVLHVQAERFVRAAELLEQAAVLAPDSEPVQYAWGVALFNARQYAEAAAPLSRAASANPGDAATRRMLALSWLNTEAYDKAAPLLARDPERDTNPQLQYAYGLSLVRSGQTVEAQQVFARLLARHGDSAEIGVVLAQAHAQDGDFEAAEKGLRKALELKKDVAEANGTLGVIYLKQGKLDQAEKALRAELALNPKDARSHLHLANVLEMADRAPEAVPVLRRALAARSEYADARYLLGKILLAQGAAPEAAEHLEAAARLAPEDANVRFQLAQAYRKLGRTQNAQAELEAYQKLKEKRREVTP